MPFAEALTAEDANRFDFAVPAELEAHEPPEDRGEARDDVRLLITDPIHGARHSKFDRLPE